MRVPFEVMKAEIKRVFLKIGMAEEKAEICAQIHTETSRDGVYSHGLNRVPRFVNYVQKGWVDVNGEPVLVHQSAVIENYDGNMGPGILNARFAMNRAVEMAKERGLGVVAMRNTTHWMRGGTYGWQAADQGCIGICWTNTESCMPPWGAKDLRIGNNPMVIAVPRRGGHFVLDMAMSLYSYGKLQVTRLKNEKLPFPGGYDAEGNLTTDPGAIEATRRLLPTGYWKGSGLAVVLDVLAAILSNGLATYAIDQVGKGSCGSCSQVFIAIDPNLAGGGDRVEEILNETAAYLKTALPVKENGEVRYPGEQTMRTRQENTEKGILVDEGVWNEVRSL